ncbi:MAG: CocE/NonD family hydrolase [Gemmobacter sp.]|nr:CocE/NonD family hydrolase [Gemmobacter sp.]
MVQALDLFAVRGPDTGVLRLADGVDLVADIYRPDGSGDYPVLLMRQPYGRKIASTVVLAHPRWYAAQGYIVVVQDVRGAGGSGGVYDPFRQEIADGAASIAWARTLPGSNGRIGLYGFSYQATCQYLALAGGGRPDAIAPAMGSWTPETDWAYEGGAFRFSLNVGWASQMARLQAERKGDGATLAALAAAVGPAAQRDYLLTRPDLTHLHDWLANDPAYWAGSSPAALLGAPPPIPVLHVAGCHDFLLGGSLGADAAFRAVSPGTTHMIMGPWSHAPWNRAAGAAQAGPGAELSVDKAQMTFFDHYLKRKGARPAGLVVYDLGTDRWDSIEDWPARDAVRLWLGSDGLAATLLSDGRLQPRPNDGADILVHDPDRPAPLIGGALGVPQGCVDRAAQDNRSDVAVYTMPPLTAPLRLLGPVQAVIDVQADAQVFDVCASLSRVTGAGHAYVLATGYARCTGSGPVSLSMGAVSITVPAGDGLRLSVQGAGTPAFELAQDQIAPCTGQRAPITMILRHAGSSVTLPAIPPPKEPHDA